MNQELTGQTVLVTGANGGLGEQFVAQALARGAAKVYAAARRPREWDDARILPLALDVTDSASIAAAAAAAGDVTVVINNAGIAPEGDSVLTGSEEQLRAILETNFFGPVAVARAFAPILAANGGGALLTVASLAAWIPLPTVYAASKAAVLAATNGLRVELSAQGTHVVAVVVGMIDTAMGARWDVPKVSAESVVAQAYDAIESGAIEVLADDSSHFVRSLMAGSQADLIEALAPQLAGFEA